MEGLRRGRRRRLDVLAAAGHGALAGLHFLGLCYALLRPRKLGHAAIHAGALVFDCASIRRHMRTMSLLVLAAALAACGAGGERGADRVVALIEGAEAEAIEGKILRWWKEAAECVGLDPATSSARLFLATDLRNARGPALRGVHLRGRIYVERDHLSEKLLRHEVVHYLLWRHGLDSDHRHRGPWWRACMGPGPAAGAAPVETAGWPRR